MSDLLQRGDTGISFGLGGLRPSMVWGPSASASAMEMSRFYYGAEPSHSPAQWPGATRNEWLNDVAQRITRLSTLGPGWDGHRARPLDRRVLQLVWNFLDQLAGEVIAVGPAVVPTVSGGVALEWHQDDVDIEIEFGGSTILVSYEDGAGAEAEGPLLEHIALVGTALRRLR